MERYNLILRDLELFQILNKLGEYGQKVKWQDNFLKELKIELSSKCEETPHYEMDEKCKL